MARDEENKPNGERSPLAREQTMKAKDKTNYAGMGTNSYE
jgi:hypothetical protein